MNYSITTQKRDGKPEETRAAGMIPAVVYGPEIEPVSVAVGYRDFEKLYDEAGESSLINVTVEGQSEPIIALIQEVQHDPVKGTISHIDFRQIKMGEEIHATVELTFVGEAPAVKSLGGTLLKGTDHVNVTCLPKDLVSHIDVDLAALATFEDSITIADLALPAGMTATDNPSTSVAKVIAPLTKEEIEKMEEDTTGSVEDIQVEGKKAEDAEGEADTSKEKADA